VTVANSFRGIQGIREIRVRIKPIVEWTKRFKPEQRTLTLERKDFDLIARWPKAANAEEFVISHNGIFYDGLQLKYSSGHGRYETRPQIAQEDFVHAGIAAEQVGTTIANVMKDRADEVRDSQRVHAGKTLDQFLSGE
jgi:hypothetical protein